MTVKNKISFLLSTLLLFAVCLSLVSAYGVAEIDQNVKVEKSSDHNHEHEIHEISTEATFPAHVFKVNVALIFMFELSKIKEKIEVSFLALKPLQISTYWVNLIASTIVVNAP